MRIHQTGPANANVAGSLHVGPWLQERPAGVAAIDRGSLWGVLLWADGMALVGGLAVAVAAAVIGHRRRTT